MKRLAALITLIVLAPSSLRAADGVPAPAGTLGFEPCAERQVATYEEIVDYFQTLDGASDRMELVDIGETAEGRTQILAIISSAANLRDLDRYREISERLARAKDLTDEQAHALASEGKAVVWIDFGLHSTERAHAQVAPRVAYEVVTGESDELRSIREDVIFLLLPNMNPDGTTLVAEWYRKNLDTPYEETGPPELYQKYVGHDNNRDWFMFNQPESRNVGRVLYHQWYPQIVYNQHQEAPFPARIFLPPFEDPMNPNIPALVMRGVNLVGESMGRRLDREGKAGALSRVSFDTWWNGGMRTAPYYHNMVGILTETAHSSPSTVTYDPDKFPKTFSTGVSTTEPSTFYPNPWLGGEWSFRDTCDYMTSTSMAVLDIGAKRKEEWLYDIYQMGRDAIAAGADETYVISADQWDAPTAAKLVNVLRWGGVEVERATEGFAVGDDEYPAGSYLVRGGQAFRPHLTDLLNPQEYPDRRLYPGGPPELPYDITGWTLSYQMGVAVDRIQERVDVSTEPVDWARPEAVEVKDDPRWGWALDPRVNDAFLLVNRLQKAGVEVARATGSLDLPGNEEWPPGAFLVAVTDAARSIIQTGAEQLGVPTRALRNQPDIQSRVLGAPRIGLYQAATGNMDEGWTRWLLEQFEFPFETVRDPRVRVGNLIEDFDVLVLPDAGFQNMLRGRDVDTMPVEYTGGMTPEGVLELYRFARSGGVLITLDSSAELPLTLFALPIRDVTDGRSSDDFFIPGSLLALDVDTDHPLGYGMEEEAIGFFARSKAFEVGRGASRWERQRGIEPEAPAGIDVVVRWADQDELLRSGWGMGARTVRDQGAVVDAALGDGRVVLLGFRVQHRGQTHGTFKLLFNALHHPAMGRASS